MRCHWDVLFSAGTQANEAQGQASRSCQPSKPDGHARAGGIPMRFCIQCGLRLWCGTTLERALDLESGDRGWGWSLVSAPSLIVSLGTITALHDPHICNKLQGPSLTGHSEDGGRPPPCAKLMKDSSSGWVCAEVGDWFRK